MNLKSLEHAPLGLYLQATACQASKHDENADNCDALHDVPTFRSGVREAVHSESIPVAFRRKIGRSRERSGPAKSLGSAYRYPCVRGVSCARAPWHRGSTRWHW